MIEVRRYLTDAGQDVFGEWLVSLRDARTRARITARLNRLVVGNFGDCKALRDGIWELRIDFGPGFRVYYAMIGRECVLLLGGGDKRRQSADIIHAVEHWNDYKRRARDR